MVDILRQWWDFLLYVIGDSGGLKDALRMYPFSCVLAIYWTQGIKRAQRRKRWRGREHLTGLELRAVSGGLSAALILLMGFAFFDHLPPRQLVAHAILGGAAAPMLVWAGFAALGIAALWSDRVAIYLERLKTGDRRRATDPQPPEGMPERRGCPEGDDTGEFWSNDVRR